MGLISINCQLKRQTKLSDCNYKDLIISGFVYCHDTPVFKGSNHMRTDTFFYHLILSSVTCHLAGNRVRMSSLRIIVEALESIHINDGW